MSWSSYILGLALVHVGRGRGGGIATALGLTRLDLVRWSTDLLWLGNYDQRCFV